MILESTGNTNPENITTAISVIYALAPAFAIGFAIQRFLEILDSWFDLDKKFSAEWKAALMSVAALAVGVLLAWTLEIEVLKTLGIKKSIFWIDYLVSGLIISAGTDGFNSILKFLSYSKDVRKTQADSEKTTSVSERIFSRMKAPSFTALGSSAGGFASALGGTLKAELKAALEVRVKTDIGNQFDPATWDETKFDILYQKLPPHLRLQGVGNVLRESFTPVLNDWGVPLSQSQWEMYLSAITLASTPAFAVEFIGTI